jgi:hypothetical protein
LNGFLKSNRIVNVEKRLIDSERGTGGEIRGNTASRAGGGVYVRGGGFSKTGGGTGGGVIYVSDGDASLKNTAADGDTNGHAVYYEVSSVGITTTATPP